MSCLRLSSHLYRSIAPLANVQRASEHKARRYHVGGTGCQHERLSWSISIRVVSCNHYKDIYANWWPICNNYRCAEKLRIQLMIPLYPDVLGCYSVIPLFLRIPRRDHVRCAASQPFTNTFIIYNNKGFYTLEGDS